MASDSWSEIGYVSITVLSGSAVEFRTLTETVDIDIGDKDFDAIPLINGGRVVKFNPQEPTEITLEAYPVEAGTVSGAVGKGFFDLLNTQDASQPLSVNVDHTRTKYRMTLLWTDSTSVTTAETIVSGAKAGLRVMCADGYFTSAKPSFTDGILKWTVKYKVPAFDKSASANVKIESTDGTADLTAPAAYGASAKW